MDPRPDRVPNVRRRRRQVIGAQAAAVVLLVFVVYTSLLRPDGPGTLRGIEAPGGNETAVNPPEDPDPGEGPDGGDGGGGEETTGPGGGDDAGGAGGAVPGDTGPASGSTVGAQVVTTPTPTEDQYGDSAKALLEKVAGGQPPGDD